MMEQIIESSFSCLPRLSAGIVVQVVSRDGQIKMLTPLVEASGDEVVIGRMPDSLSARQSYFGFNQTLLIRTIDRGVIYSCETRVVDVSLHRARLRMSTTPQEICRQYQRTEQRYDCALCAYLHGHCAVQDGCVANISAGGCQLTVTDERVIAEIKELYAHAEQLHFEVLFPHSDRYQQLSGTIVSMVDDHDDNEGATYRVGLAFACDQSVVQEYIQLLRLG